MASGPCTGPDAWRTPGVCALISRANPIRFSTESDFYHGNRNMKDQLYVQYGCGSCAPADWLNFDASPDLRVERLPVISKLLPARFPKNVKYGDIVKGLPVEPGSCKAVYCCHVLEHLALEDFRTALRNTRRILKSDGVFRFVVPDLENLIGRYNNNPSKDAAADFMRNSCLGHETRPRDLKGLLVFIWGFMNHFWMWDYKSIVPELETAGFRDIRRVQFNDSPDPMFTQVEEKYRWDDCLGIECRK